jgi:hypothetical protein
MLAEAKSLDEVKAVVDLAEAAKTYARAARLGQEAQYHAAEIAQRGMRKAGAILAKLEKGEGGRPPKTGDRQSGVSAYRRTIDEAGVKQWEARKWQRVAEVDDTVFETYIAETKSDQGEITVTDLLRFAKKYKPADQIQAATEFDDIDTGFITADERDKGEALSRGLESEVQTALGRYLKLGMDRKVAAEVLRRIADELTGDSATAEDMA